MLARSYAERAKSQYEEIADRANVGKLLNNLGGLNFLLGKPDEAVTYLKDAFKVLLEYGSEEDAARAVNSLAQVHLRSGDVRPAEEQARQALELLKGRVDHLDEIGNAQLVLGRALLEQDRLDEADSAFALGRVELRTAFFAQPPSRGLDRPGRPGDAPRRRSRSGRPVQACGRGAPGRPLLAPRKEVTT